MFTFSTSQSIEAVDPCESIELISTVIPSQTICAWSSESESPYLKKIFEFEEFNDICGSWIYSIDRDESSLVPESPNPIRALEVDSDMRRIYMELSKDLLSEGLVATF